MTKFFNVVAALFVFSALSCWAEEIPPANPPVYLLSGMRPINPGKMGSADKKDDFALVPWEQALAHAGVPADSIANLKPLEGKPFFGWERFKLSLEPCKVGPEYYEVIKKFAAGHPHPNPRLRPATVLVEPNTDPNSKVKPSGDSKLYTVTTGTSNFQPPATDAFTRPPGTNQLPNVDTNLFDGYGIEMPNTLPSTKLNPYNLHDGEPTITEINQTSPTDDLKNNYYEIIAKAKLAKVPPQGEQAIDAEIRKRSIRELIQNSIDILEGNPIPDRKYSGFPLLHYDGPNKIKYVTRYAEPRKIANGDVSYGNVDIHQIWYDNHIESDTALLNASDVWDVPWTMTYTIDVLARGHDDFSPFAMFTDDPTINRSESDPNGMLPLPPESAVGKSPLDWKPQPPGLPHYGMDQSFFPMNDGTRTVVRIKMPPGKYFHLIYTWGWRIHPPRVQSTDRATKAFPDPDDNMKKKTLVKWETDVFGENPKGIGVNDPEERRKKQLDAIAKIGDLSPAKRMWIKLNAALIAADKDDYDILIKNDSPEAYYDWHNRGIMKLPRLSRDAQELLGRQRLVDPETDLTLLYVNNMIYGEFSDGGVVDFPTWTQRAKPDDKQPTLRVTIYNGDHFRHAYVNVDFGGARGWENQFKSSVQSGGSGCWFTFGRANWWVNSTGYFVDQRGQPIIDETTGIKKMAGPITLPAADPDNYLESVFANVQKVNISYNYEPSRRLRFYQFDPTHHDVCILSIH